MTLVEYQIIWVIIKQRSKYINQNNKNNLDYMPILISFVVRTENTNKENCITDKT